MKIGKASKIDIIIIKKNFFVKKLIKNYFF